MPRPSATRVAHAYLTSQSKQAKAVKFKVPVVADFQSYTGTFHEGVLVGTVGLERGFTVRFEATVRRNRRLEWEVPAFKVTGGPIDGMLSTLLREAIGTGQILDKMAPERDY